MNQVKWRLTFSEVSIDPLEVWAFNLKEAIDISEKLTKDLPSIPFLIKAERIK